MSFKNKLHDSVGRSRRMESLDLPREGCMLYRLEFRAMGCEMLAVVDADMEPSLLCCVPDWFEEWEQVLSRFRIDSELTRLNQMHEHPIHASKTLWDVLQAARQAEQMTDGLVTPAVLHAILEAGYDRPFDELAYQTTSTIGPKQKELSPRRGIHMDHAEQTVSLPSGVKLDFGGIAKGWAAYEAVKRLQAKGPALIDAGGDIAVSRAMSDGSPWPIGVANPFHPEEEIETLFLSGGGVATSGKDRRHWMKNGALQHHIIDPSTKKPAESDVLTVTVIAPDVMKAEAAAKAAFILGSTEGLDWIEEHPELEAIFIIENGRQIRTSNLDQYTKQAC